ncbi:MAG TPA: IS21 family transposase [Bryobacteraceae bacterium]|nr:IS21 family transposase [Bryobacteraceae bacterium]
MSNVLNEEKKQQAVALGRLGWSLRRIQKAIGVRRETISVYLKAAGVAMRAPRGQIIPAKPARREEGVITDPACAKPASLSEVITDSGRESATLAEEKPDPRPGRSPSSSACTPHREVIELGLSRGRNAMAIWQELVDTCGFAGGYQSVRRFVSRLHGSQHLEACAVIETPPGEESQVDYGEGPMVRDPQSGKYRRTRLFVLTLGYSRKSVRLLVFRSSSQTWAELHEKAFRRLGGATRVVVLDNLREGVLTPDVYDPTLNPLYRDMLRHYGAVPLPCRVGHPDRKGKVESGVGHAQKTPLKGLRFETLEEAQTYLDCWEERWADTRIHGTTKRQVAVMFAEERPSLLALPVEPFRYYLYGERTVHLDGCVEVEAAYYSAPPGWIGRRVQVQWDSRHVRLLDPQNGQLLREHMHQKRGGHRIKDEDRSRKTPTGTQQLLCRADKAGSQIGALCRGMHQAQGEVAVRRIMGVLSLGKKYGVARVDDACAVALEVGVCDYPFVRRYLERNPQLPLNLRQIDPLIRQLTLYRDFIDNKTSQESKE